MEFYEVINKRRTIRDFENLEINDDTIEKIIGAGLMAPTNDHMRDWHFVVIKDKKILMRLLELILNEIKDDDMEQLIKDWNLNDTTQQSCYRDAVSKQKRMLANASVVIIPLLK